MWLQLGCSISLDIDVRNQASDSLEGRAQQPASLIQVSIRDRLLVVLLLSLVVLDVLEEDWKDSGAVEVQLLTLAFVKDYNIVNLSMQVKPPKPHKEGDECQPCHSRREGHKNDEPLQKHRRVVIVPTIDWSPSNDFREDNDWQEEKDLLYQHVCKIIRSVFVQQRIAVAEADAVACLAVGTLFEQSCHDFVSDADAMELGPAVARLDQLLRESLVSWYLLHRSPAAVLL